MNKSFTGATVLLPDLRIPAGSFKTNLGSCCVSCYLERKGDRTSPTSPLHRLS
ncbi:MAG: hypothetical protein IPH54_22435 [Rhodoferax sp.]|nr:hypothetical protein [Rhodoferax sp.]